MWNSIYRITWPITPGRYIPILEVFPICNLGGRYKPVYNDRVVINEFFWTDRYKLVDPIRWPYLLVYNDVNN